MVRKIGNIPESANPFITKQAQMIMYMRAIMSLTRFLLVIVLLERGSCFLLRPQTLLHNRFLHETRSDNEKRSSTAIRATTSEEETDVVVIGSGIGGLSAAACLASTEHYDVTVCESHDTPGGAAHEWQIKGFHFESGPSLYAGFSPERSPNPLKHVFQVIGEEPDWITYDRWGTYLPEGKRLIADAVGADEFYEKLKVCGGPDASEQWTRLMKRITPLGEAIFALPSAAVRADAFVAVTMGLRYAPALAGVLTKGGSSLQDPFINILEEEKITDPFIRNWLDMICFLLQGATTKDAPTTLMAYMLSDFYRPNVKLDFPVGGTQSIVNALVRGVTKHQGSQVLLNSHVKNILVNDEGKAAGVELANGKIIRARKAVLSNADLWSTRKMINPKTAPKLAEELDERIARLDRCDSFLHLHVGINATGLPMVPNESFPAQWASLESWERGVDAPRNLVLVSVASLLDPSLAPEGCHTIHAYVPATEPYAPWANMDRTSAEYRRKKEEASEVLWKAIEQQIPDVRDRAVVTLVGTPLTHELFLRRDQGSYGPFLKATDGMLDGTKTCLPDFWCCGDSTFPGIGMPAAAASGMIAANSVMSPLDHWKLLDRIKL